jgi:acetate kinase
MENAHDLTEPITEAKIERVGNPDYALFTYSNPGTGFVEKSVKVKVPTYTEGINLFLSRLTDSENGAISSLEAIDAIGFKTVIAKGYHGIHELTEDVLAAMEAYNSVAPAHNPPYIEAIRKFKEILGDKLFVGVFETAFHTTIPLARKLYALPYEWYEKYGIQRLGFHGASHRFIAEEITKRVGPKYRLISCHMGGSGSLCAIQDGKSADTSFGFSLQTGIPHANRCGDTDAYIIPFLMSEGMEMWEILHGIDQKGGLLGLSGVSNDLREVEQAAQSGNTRAQLAIDVFCESVVKYIGAFAAVMGGLDYLVFTGGIGENSCTVRNAICSRLGWLGASIDVSLAPENALDGVISCAGSSVTVAVIPTNEEMGIARAIYANYRSG